MKTTGASIAGLLLSGTLICVAHAASSRPLANPPPERARIGIQGIVVEGGPGGFVLLSGETRINVSMRNWKWYDDYAAIDGDRATVFGPMNRALFKSHTILPDAVYIADLKTYFQNGASPPAVEQPSLASYIFRNEPLGDYVSLSGEVVAIGDGRLEIAVPGGTLTVDTTRLAGGGELAGSPVGNVQTKDRVAVVGSVDDEFWSKLTIRADDIVKLAMATPTTAPR